MVEHFGDRILLPDGRLDRQAVADIVFGDKEQLEALGKIVHPRVQEELLRRVAELSETDDIVILDIPLLAESGWEGLVGTIVVDLEPELAVERLVTHRGFGEDDARARIANQASREERLAKAEWVVDNSGDPDALDPQVSALWDELQRRRDAALEASRGSRPGPRVSPSRLSEAVGRLLPDAPRRATFRQAVQGRLRVPTGGRPAAGDRASCPTGVWRGERFQTLLGITGSGKSATMAWTIEQVQKPTLVIAPNKSLAAQLANEFREFFPENRVEYFVSYYDYYQPEAYMPSSDTYIEKDATVNDEIDRLRHAATSALLTRRDTIVVASVSLHLRPRLARGVRSTR